MAKSKSQITDSVTVEKNGEPDVKGPDSEQWSAEARAARGAANTDQ